MSNKIGGLPVDKGGFRAESRTGAGMTRGFAAWMRRLLRCDRGVAAVEFGLSAPLLLGVIVPVADLGIAFSRHQQLQHAVQAGALYAASHPWSQSAATAIASAVTTATPLSGISVSPAPYQQCGCPGSGGGITTATCGSTCNNGETAGYYAVISAQLAYTPILPYSVLGSSTILTAQSMIRIR